MDNTFNFNRFVISTLVVLIFNFSALHAETKWGETRLGFEFTPISDAGFTVPYNFKFKQKILIYDNKVQVKAFRRHYVFNKDNGNKEYNRLKLDPSIEMKNHLFYEGLFDFYSGDRDDKKYKNILGAWYKFGSYLKLKGCYVWKDKFKDNEHIKSNAYAMILTGDIFKLGKHKLQYENYNFRDSKKNNYDIDLEFQYKYSVSNNIDLYAYLVNGYKIRKNKKDNRTSRLDLGIYWYF